MSSALLAQYLSELSATDEALKSATGERLQDLLNLKAKICEVISLLQGTQDEPAAESTNSTSVKTEMDDEFARFQTEIEKIDQQTDDSLSSSSDSENGSYEGEVTQEDQELRQLLSSLEGSKCRAPFSREWGEMDYHNAMIISAECSLESSQSLNEVLVKVMFCNPLCDEMKPCAFFLNGYCKYSEDTCRFSHGYEVQFSELQEFILPDFTSLTVDSPCLAKGDDDTWYKAIVEKCMEENRYLVKHGRTGKTRTLDAADILPLCIDNDVENEHDHDNIEDQMRNEMYQESESKVSIPISAFNMPAGTWEQHTKGIGSKLMEKMGHVWGQGLGKNSDGRLDPVEAVILPSGKSLDKCIEMRENCSVKGPVTLETRLEIDKDREEQKAKRLKLQAERTPQKESVFDFLNSRISKLSRDGRTLDIRKNHKLSQQQPTSSKNLNVQIFSVGEDLKKAKKELARLKQTLIRNTGRNEALCSQVQRKIAIQNETIQNLQEREKKLGADIKSQTNHKKLTIF